MSAVERDETSKFDVIFASLAAGMPPADILSSHPWLTGGDIRDAARRALDLHRRLQSGGIANSLAERRKTHKRAYEKWQSIEEQELINLFDGGATIPEISHHLGRGRGAIVSRLARLGRT